MTNNNDVDNKMKIEIGKGGIICLVILMILFILAIVGNYRCAKYNLFNKMKIDKKGIIMSGVIILLIIINVFTAYILTKDKKKCDPVNHRLLALESGKYNNICNNDKNITNTNSNGNRNDNNDKFKSQHTNVENGFSIFDNGGKRVPENPIPRVDILKAHEVIDYGGETDKIFANAHFSDVLMYHGSIDKDGNIIDSGIERCIKNCDGRCIEYGLTTTAVCFPTKIPDT